MDPILRRVQVEGATALTLGSALAGATVARVAFPHAIASAAVLGAMLGVLGLAAGTRPNAHEENRGLDGLAILGTAISMPITIGLAWPGGVCFAFFVGPPAGLALAMFWWSLLAPLRRLAVGRAFDDPDRARAISGRWLALLGSVSAPMIAFTSDLVLAILAIAIAAFGLSRAVLATRRLRRRAEWLELARRGALGVLIVVPREHCPREELASLPALVRTDARLDGVLVERSEAGPYRAHLRPRALVALHAR